MQVIKDYCTEFIRFGQKREGELDSIEIHSIGAAQNTAEVIRNNMNQRNPGGIVHAIVASDTEDKVIEILPADNVSWADGGYGNHHSYTVEIAESDSMKYVPGSAEYTVTDEERFLTDIERGYRNAVKYIAMKCREFGFDPTGMLPNGLHVVYSHQEANEKGLATAHVDPIHVWVKIGKTMDTFRADVNAALGEADVKEYRVQCGSFSIRANAGEAVKQLEKAGFEAIIKEENGAYKVQCGSFALRANADALAEKLRKAGFEAIVI